MKYKRKQIQKIKERFNMERLHFFKGYREIVFKDNNVGITIMGKPMSMGSMRSNIIICSTKRHYKKVYRNHPYMRATARMNHRDVGEIFEGLAGNGWFTNKWGIKMKLRPIWFEQTDTEHNDLESLKKACLIHYLSGI